MDDVGQTIQMICERAEITYKQLSQLLHVSPDAVSDWANGINTPRKQNAEQIRRLKLTSTKNIRNQLGLPDLEIDMTAPKPKWVWEEPIKLISINWPIVYAVGHTFCIEKSCEWRKNGYCFWRKCIKMAAKKHVSPKVRELK